MWQIIKDFFSSLFNPTPKPINPPVDTPAEIPTPDEPDLNPPKHPVDWTKLEEGTPEFYRAAYKALEFDPGYESKVEWNCRKVLEGKKRYEEVTKRVGFKTLTLDGITYEPWFIIGLIHMKEASCDFSKVLHNGESLTSVNANGTKLVPKGRGKGKNWTWEDAAVDAMTLNGSRWNKILNGALELGEILYAVERYNGTGYITGAGRAEYSPYLWAMSNINDDFGKYVSDGKFDPNAPTNKACGFATMLKWLEINNYVKVYSLPAPKLQPAPESPDSETSDIGAGLVKLAQDNGVSTKRMNELIEFQKKDRPGKNPRFWALIDMSLHSKYTRFYLFDRIDGTVSKYHTAHGSGSDKDNDGYADKFSNVSGSHCTSLGFYRVAETYNGANGLSCRLDGKSITNSRARARAVVLHGSDYVGYDYVKRMGRCGRSQGCPATDRDATRHIITSLQNGSPLYIYNG